jgi:hypothetical protein
LINSAYAVGEKGMWKDVEDGLGGKRPFARTNDLEIEEMAD